MNEPLRHHEIEIKYELDDRQGFNDALKWMEECGLKTGLYEKRGFIVVTGADTYYRQGRNVVRHRRDVSQSTNQLTVKRRTSTDSTVNREEIDLDFAPTTNAKDVTAFLLATGWKAEVTLTKTSHIMKLYERESGVEVTIAIYTVDCLGHSRRFFAEVEVEKDSRVSETKAEKLLEDWKVSIATDLSEAKQQKLSLYELYSGNRYSLVPEKE